MNNKADTVGGAINQYIMYAALPFGGYFIVEYLVRNYSATNIMLSFLNIPMMVLTVVFLYLTIKNMRDKLLNGVIYGFMAWTAGTQLMLFSGLIEAAFIYIFNQFIVPTNLLTVHNSTIEQYENLLLQLQTMPDGGAFLSSAIDTVEKSIALLKEAPVATPIETAITAFSNDIFFGMILMMFIAPIIKRKSPR